MSFTIPASRRLGRFSIANESIQDRPGIVSRIMGACIIVRAEMLYASNRIEYHAICYRFRPVQFGEVMPEYRWIIREDGDIEAEEVPAGPAGWAVDSRVVYA